MISGEFELETINDEITLLVLMPGIITMDAQGAYDLAHVLIESANKLQRKNALTITFGKDS